MASTASPPMSLTLLKTGAHDVFFIGDIKTSFPGMLPIMVSRSMFVQSATTTLTNHPSHFLAIYEIGEMERPCVEYVWYVVVNGLEDCDEYLWAQIPSLAAKLRVQFYLDYFGSELLLYRKHIHDMTPSSSDDMDLYCTSLEHILQK